MFLLSDSWQLHPKDENTKPCKQMFLAISFKMPKAENNPHAQQQMNIYSQASVVSA